MAPENGAKKIRDNVRLGCALTMLAVAGLAFFGSGSGDKDSYYALAASCLEVV